VATFVADDEYDRLTKVAVPLKLDAVKVTVIVPAAVEVPVWVGLRNDG